MASKFQEKQITKSTLVGQRDQFKLKIRKFHLNTQIIYEETGDGIKISNDLLIKLKLKDQIHSQMLKMFSVFECITLNCTTGNITSFYIHLLGILHMPILTAGLIFRFSILLFDFFLSRLLYLDYLEFWFLVHASLCKGIRAFIK
ncbi:hypothetical protein BpHYR1_004026 [Brachionus plicatilis]|uniref:Uncharacterized protein n=1 Tax=Brachionus plicatilis TaxID=10195 RepID=A0A3M7T2Z7_BRAPC|nr:hypothetical protein BpHYR1_004026 [Brachionus plicatilis]